MSRSRISAAAGESGVGRLSEELRAAANPATARVLQGFFKTGPGQYGEGDVFLGIKVPVIRKLVKQYPLAAPEEVLTLLHSVYHEERLAALFLWIQLFERGGERTRRQIFKLYLGNTRWINNWDLVDLSAPQIIGKSLTADDGVVLDKLVRSPLLWERRIAIVATLTFTRAREFGPGLRLCRELLGDKHDLMHKACGWMLREIGKRDRPVLTRFLDAHVREMPRTMLRYSIEHFSRVERDRWLKA